MLASRTLTPLRHSHSTGTDELHEGVNAFLQKRKPRFRPEPVDGGGGTGENDRAWCPGAGSHPPAQGIDAIRILDLRLDSIVRLEHCSWARLIARSE
jgi:hypothetical protein